MAQHDYVIDNGPGLAVRTDINAMAAAIQSSNSGTVEPAAKVPGQVWFNTTTGQLQVRNSGNTAWSPIGGLSTDGLTLFLKEGTTTRGSVAAAGGATPGTIALRCFNNTGVQTGLFYLDSSEVATDKAVFSLYFGAADSAIWFRKNDGNIRCGVYSFTGGSIDLRAHNTTSNTLVNLLRVGADRQMASLSYGMTWNSDGTSGDVFQNHRVSTSRATRLYFSTNGDWVIQQSDDNFASHFINCVQYQRGGNIVAFSHRTRANGYLLNAAGSNGGILNGPGDGASFGTFNVSINSWWGVGFVSDIDGACRIVFDVRSGRMTASETLISGNMYMTSGTRYQQDGNIIFTAGMASGLGYSSLYDALGAVIGFKAGLYTGDVQDETNFPNGHSVITRGGTTPARNQTATIRLGVSIAQEYRHNNGTGAILAGVWRGRGYFDDAEGGISGCLFQRTA